MIETLILLASPVIVSLLVQVQKQAYSIKFSPNKKTILRVAAGVFSFLGVFAASLADQEPMSAMYIEEAVSTALVFIATQVPYLLGKNKSSV